MSQTVTVRYTATRKFKSEGVWYAPGDEWTPTGDERKDSKVIGRFVQMEMTPVDSTERPATRVKRGNRSK